MTVPTRDELLDHIAAGTLLDALFGDYAGHGPDRQSTIDAIASVHNNGAVDLLALVTPESLAAHEGYRFFQGQQVYCDLIGKIAASAEALVRVVDALIVAAGNDGAAGFPANALGKWCEADPARPAAILDLVDRGVPRADHFLTMALTRGAVVDPVYFTDRAYGFLETGTDVERLAAIGALGRIPLGRAAEWERLVTAFRAAITPDPGDDQRSAILAAVVLRLKAAPMPQKAELVEIGLAAIAPLGDRIQYECASTLALHHQDLDPVFVEALLGALVSLDPTKAGTIEMLDLGLMKLVEDGEPAKARAFLAKLLGHDDDILTLKRFDSLCHKLHEGDRQVLEDWIVDWLILGEVTLCLQLNDSLFVSGADETVLSIDFTRFNLSDAEFPYLARKAIGFFFFKPVVMASLVTSLLRYAPSVPAKEIEGLLLEPILLSYSGVARDYLEPIANDPTDPAAAAARRTIGGLQAYLDGMKAIGLVPELCPSERERQLEWQRHSDEMAETQHEAEKQSVLLQFVHRSVMLYGNRSISYVRDPVGPPRRIETKLASFEASFEMPRTEIVDPLGLRLMLIQFRSESRPA